MSAPNRVCFRAAFCLISLVALPVPGYSSEPPSNELLVYLSADAAQPQRPLDYMKLELGRLMTTAGYRVEWRDARVSGRETAMGDLAFVELRGACGLPMGSAISESLRKSASFATSSFATTSVSDGRVLPFSSVNCASLSQALVAHLASEPGARRDYLYGRAMARVLAHELYHVLARSGDHAHQGIARASFTANDLLTERFDFEQTTLAQLRRQPEIISHATADAALGR
jgi:hypothetical protein